MEALIIAGLFLALFVGGLIVGIRQAFKTGNKLHKAIHRLPD